MEKFDYNNEEYVNDQISAIETMMMHRSYALLNGLNVGLVGNRPRKFSRDQIRRATQNPYDNVSTLQQISENIECSNGIYQELLEYQSGMLTNDYMLIPISLGNIKSKSGMTKILEEQAKFVGKYNLKYNSIWIYREAISKGELYLYKLENSDMNILQKLPPDFCKTVAKENDVHRYAVDLSKITDKTVVYFPKEIQLAYKKYKNKSKTLKLIDKSYYQVGKNGVSFPIKENATKGIPYYTPIFDDLIQLEDKKDLMNDNDVIEAIKLIHQKLPRHKETGEVQMSAKQAAKLHEATKANLPKQAAIVTNPLDIEVLTMSDGGSKLRDSVKRATEAAYDSSGVNVELFNGKKNSNEAIASGIVVDSFLTQRLQKMIENWINFELSSNKKSGMQFKIKFIDSNKFNKDNKVKAARENMAYGGSRFEFMATQGHEPIEGINLLKMENILEMDTIMIPQKSAHTLSKNDETGKGRPSKVEEGGEGQSSQPEEE